MRAIAGRFIAISLFCSAAIGASVAHAEQGPSLVASEAQLRAFLESNLAVETEGAARLSVHVEGCAIAFLVEDHIQTGAVERVIRSGVIIYLGDFVASAQSRDGVIELTLDIDTFSATRDLARTEVPAEPAPVNAHDLASRFGAEAASTLYIGGGGETAVLFTDSHRASLWLTPTPNVAERADALLRAHRLACAHPQG